jgi:hypothetical protein
MMTTRAKLFFALILISALGALALAQGKRVSLRPGFKAGQQERYLVTGTVDTVVTPKGAEGLASNTHRELTATVVLRAVDVTEKGNVSLEATVEEISLRVSADGAESAVNASEMAGKKIQLTLDRAGNLAKAVIPESPDHLKIAELLSSLLRWYPTGEVAVGETWQVGGQGPFYSEMMSEISKGSTTVYKLTSLDEGAAMIEGEIRLSQSGASILTTKDGRTNVSVIAQGKGVTRFEYDTAAGHITGGTTESKLEGRLVHVPPKDKGEKLQPREGSLVETSKFTIKLNPGSSQSS